MQFLLVFCFFSEAMSFTIHTHSPGKIILLGEHSVVYNRTALCGVVDSCRIHCYGVLYFLQYMKNRRKQNRNAFRSHRNQFFIQQQILQKYLLIKFLIYLISHFLVGFTLFTNVQVLQMLNHFILIIYIQFFMINMKLVTYQRVLLQQFAICILLYQSI